MNSEVHRTQLIRTQLIRTPVAGKATCENCRVQKAAERLKKRKCSETVELQQVELCELRRSRVCAICDRARPVSEYTKAGQLACAGCSAKRRQQHALRQCKKKIQTESLQTQCAGWSATATAQSAEIERLQAVMVALNTPDAISDQHLHQLWTQPHDTAVMSQLLAASVPPSKPQDNITCSTGLASGHSVQGDAQPHSKLPSRDSQNYSCSSSGARSSSEDEQQQHFPAQPAEDTINLEAMLESLDTPIDFDIFDIFKIVIETENDASLALAVALEL